ncbi:hypothetical protein [Paraglaciecola polaris]|uniref:Uncharacterized protein n=1 Tax=Paraglaciecola polaris LMG 21857 TaxID=1129793 RepID=K6YN67_9ALTE|nr:hypothetical protein [Paraglaciecola polaris]GAC34139.1 hypothetical protein GPLA_3249 [Paraglaciecola polaris LMG 21857]
MDGLEALNKNYLILKNEVDSIQISLLSQKTAWYKKIPVIISILALTFSFGTTYVSNKRIKIQDIQAIKSDLRNMLQQLSAIPSRNFELTKKYSDDPNAVAFVGGQINQENALLASQAAELIEQLPDDRVSAIEAYSVAVALQFSYQNQKAFEMYELSHNLATDMNTNVAAKRGMANILFISGQAEAGRVQFQEALNTFSIFKGYNDFIQKTTHIVTLLNWFGAESGSGFNAQSIQKLNEAENISKTLRPGPYTVQVQGQIQQARNQIIGLSIQSTTTAQ